MCPQLREVVAAGCIAALAGCAPGPERRRAVPSYDDFTGRLIQLSADQNGDGRIDQWTYLDANGPVRGEADTDDDGRIDRWEYFDAAAALTQIGTSSRGDGVEDTLTYPALSNDGETLIVTYTVTCTGGSAGERTSGASAEAASAIQEAAVPTPEPTTTP